jgi:hypothetical protein
MTYFILAYLCITGPIVTWVLISQEKWKGKTIVISGYLIFSVVFFEISRIVKNPLETIYHGLMDNSWDANLPNACQGSLDEVTAGLRRVPAAGKEVIEAGAGRKLTLRGWIGSDLPKDLGVAVRLIQKSSGHSCLELKTKIEKRPDVAIFMANPMTEWGGFVAEGIIPKNLPLGRYKVLIERKGITSSDQFSPQCAIEVISLEAGAALDAPLEKELNQKPSKTNWLVRAKMQLHKDNKYP